MAWSPMIHKIVGALGSLILGAIVCWINELTCSIQRIFSGLQFIIFRFWVHKSFKNLA